MKYIIASHGQMASGMKKTIEMLIGKNENLFFLNAYVESQNFHEEAKELLDTFPSKETIYVFTDIPGGSVNQVFSTFINDYRIQLISGINLPLILEFVLRNEELTDEQIDDLIEQARKQIIHINKIK